MEGLDEIEELIDTAKAIIDDNFYIILTVLLILFFSQFKEFVIGILPF